MIGVIGGYGNIGTYTINALLELGEENIKVGGRNRKKSKLVFPMLPFQNVDVKNEEEIEQFVKDCSIIVNCTGPSARGRSIVTEVCKRKKMHLVDVGMSEMEFSMKIRRETTATFVHGAGASPGFSSLITRWGGEKLGNVRSIEVYMGFLDTFTRTAAEDYMHGVFGSFNLNGKCWRDSKVCISDLCKEKKNLPYFQTESTIIPFFDTESEYVATNMNISSGKWYTVIDEPSIEECLLKIQKEYFNDLDAAVDKLCSVTRIATLGRKNYMNLLIQYNTEKQTKDTVVVLSNGPAELSGYTAAATVLAIKDRELETGEYALAQLKDPNIIIRKLKKNKRISINLIHKGIDELLNEEEGEI